MKVYLAMGRASSAEALTLQERIATIGLRPISTWALDDELPVGKRECRVALDNSDRELADAAAMLVVSGPNPDPELFIRVGQAIELHMPIIWCAPYALDVARPGFRLATSVDDGLDILVAWSKRLRGGIGDEYARRALWVMLQAQDAREADTASARVA